MSPEKQTKRDGNSINTVSDDTVLKVAKEVAIKFIEMGRITPATFDDTFRNIHTTIKETVDGRKDA